MKKNLLVFTLVFLVAGTIILSCSKSGGGSTTPNSTCKMTQWVQGIGNNDTVNTITYDNNGHLSKIKATYGGLYPDTLLFTYDANGRLSTTVQPSDIQTYTYNSNGLLSTITATWGNQTYITYGVNNLPTLVKNYYNGALSTIDSVQFDSNGDLISVKEVSG